MKTSARGLKLIEEFEGFRSNPYDCEAGHCTVGFGHLIHRGRTGTRPLLEEIYTNLSREDARELLRIDIQAPEDAIARLVKHPLKQCQFDALASFIYNFGRGAFRTSTLLKRLNAGRCCSVPDELVRWNKVRKNGKLVVSKGLVRRRAAEVSLWKGETK